MLTIDPNLLNPGSKEAREAGCQCPVIDNHYGRGMGIKNAEGETMFVISGNCEVHREWEVSE